MRERVKQPGFLFPSNLGFISSSTQIAKRIKPGKFMTISGSGKAGKPAYPTFPTRDIS